MDDNITPLVPAIGPIPQLWAAKRKVAILLEMIQGKTTAVEVACQHGRV